MILQVFLKVTFSVILIQLKGLLKSLLKSLLKDLPKVLLKALLNVLIKVLPVSYTHLTLPTILLV